jgi:hypothetical protein
MTKAGALVALVLTMLAVLSIAAASASAGQVFKLKEQFGSAVEPMFSAPTAMTVDPSTEDLLVVDQSAGTISRFNPDGTADEFTALGSNVIDEANGAPLSFGAPRETQIAVDNSGGVADGDIYVTQASPPAVDIFASTGAYLGQLTESGSTAFSGVSGVAVDPSGNIYVGDTFGPGVEKFTPTTNPATNASFVGSLEAENLFPLTLAAGSGSTAGALFTTSFFGGVQKQDSGSGSRAYEFAPGPVTTESVSPAGRVIVAGEAEVAEFDASGAASATKGLSFEAPTIVTGVAAGTGGVVYVSREGSETLEVWEPVKVPTPTVSAPSSITPTTAQLNGTVNPEGLSVLDCKFEWGTKSSGVFDHSAPCVPSAAAIPVDTTDHTVSAEISGLIPNAAYRYRLTAENENGRAVSQIEPLATNGPPQLIEARASSATKTAVTLEAEIDPRGFGTGYRFEWGETAAYGNVSVGEIPQAAAGSGPVRVVAKLSDLSPGTTYHYRVYAESSAGVVETADELAETLNRCELPEQRCFELVSPRDVGPVDQPGLFAGAVELHFQAANAPGTLAYVSETGPPGATKGAEVLSRAVRGPADWVSAQLSPELTGLNETATGSSASSKYFALNEEASCGVVASNQPLTANQSTKAVIEAGGVNLYRQNPNGSFTPITTLIPENPEAGEAVPNAFVVKAMSEDCGTVVFRTTYRYPGVPVAGGSEPLYEWSEGALRSVGYVPGESGEVLSAASVGAPTSSAFPYNFNGVSANGTRVFFSASRLTSRNPAEIGSRGVFVREAGEVSRDLSLSETEVGDTGATFQFATKSGSRVYFTANAGLTDESHTEGQDLYEYDLESGTLSDLTVTGAKGGAAVAGFVGASEDGSHVYFVAAGQLVPGEGPTLAENQTDETYSVYSEQNGTIRFVGPIHEAGLSAAVIGPAQTSRVSPEGRYLLFESTADVTGYDSGGKSGEAYLFDSAETSDATVCVSCRQDGAPSVSPPVNTRIATTERPSNSMYAPRGLAVRNAEPIVFFSSFDQLAPGAEEGQNNVYEWIHGQVFLIAAEPAGLQPGEIASGTGQEATRFVGASEDGTDLYLGTPQTLTWEDGDARNSIYDARVAGGHLAPSPPPAPCSPTVEGSCQGPSAASSTPPGPATGAVSSGNVAKNKQHKKKQHKKKQHKKKQHKKKQHKKKQHKKKQHKKKHGANRNKGTGK